VEPPEVGKKVKSGGRGAVNLPPGSISPSSHCVIL
jgi:hypothetical protein